jgi:hypothetical protein
MLEIVEIQERSNQGRTRPFKCKCADGDMYFVKGKDAGPRSLICEWLAGSMAKAIGVPIPPFSIAKAPKALVAMHPDGQDLGTGPLFASKAVESIVELGFAHISKVPEATRRLIAVFDWWVNNDDRSLTAHGGNPNLIWKPDSNELVAIDHNLAFDPTFDKSVFMQTHVFAPDMNAVLNDLAEQGVYSDKLAQALFEWPVALRSMPGEWMFLDEEETVRTDFDLAEAFQMLEKCRTESFWRVGQ